VVDGEEKRNGMSVIVLKSLFPISKDENFQVLNICKLRLVKLVHAV
jgi:hypothetical protein